MLTISSAPHLLCLFDSSTTIQCYRRRTLATADKVVRTGNSLEVRYGANHMTHKGAMVLLAAVEPGFCAYGRITSLIDANKFTVDALYSGFPNGGNTQDVQVIMLNEASCASWIQRALEDENIAGAFRVAFVPSRGGRNGSEVASELMYIRRALKTPMIVLGSLSTANDLLNTGVNSSASISTFNANLRQLLADGHTIGITNIRPMDLSYGVSPNATQQRALLTINSHFKNVARDYRDVGVIDWYSRFVDKSDVNGGSRLNLLKDNIHFNTNGAVEAGRDVADYLLLQMRTKPAGILRSGLWDGPARGNVAGCNICGALETNASFTPSEIGSSGQLTTHCTLTGNGNLRTAVFSLIQLTEDSSYKQRAVLGGGPGQSHTIRIEGPTGAKIAASMVPGGLYQIAMRYSAYDLELVQKIEVTADATIQYPTLGAVTGYLGAGISHQGEGPGDTPNLYRPTMPRQGVMEFPELIKIPDDALSIDTFGININVEFHTAVGSATIEFDHPTIRRVA